MLGKHCATVSSTNLFSSPFEALLNRFPFCPYHSTCVCLCFSSSSTPNAQKGCFQKRPCSFSCCPWISCPRHPCGANALPPAHLSRCPFRGQRSRQCKWVLEPRHPPRHTHLPAFSPKLKFYLFVGWMDLYTAFLKFKVVCKN